MKELTKRFNKGLTNIFNKKRVNLKVGNRKIDKTIHEQKRYEIYSNKKLTR